MNTSPEVSLICTRRPKNRWWFQTIPQEPVVILTNMFSSDIRMVKAWQVRNISKNGMFWAEHHLNVGLDQNLLKCPLLLVGSSGFSSCHKSIIILSMIPLLFQYYPIIIPSLSHYINYSSIVLYPTIIQLYGLMFHTYNLLKPSNMRWLMSWLLL